MFFTRNIIPDASPFIREQDNFEKVNTNILTEGQHLDSEKNIEHLNTFVQEEEDEEIEDEEIEIEDENTIYVITIDNEPFTYEKELNSAKIKVDSMVKKYNLNDVGGYHTNYINYKNDYEIDIIRNFDLGIFSINYIIHTFSIYRLQK